jgi:Transposase zinc-ribbon domain/ISXO2-like transposase domain
MQKPVKTKNHLQIHQLTIAQFEKQFPNEDACRLYLQANRWPDGVIRCPRCGNDKVHPHIMGTFHKVSRTYLPLYVNEFEFRYNKRSNPDIFGAAIRAC